MQTFVKVALLAALALLAVRMVHKTTSHKSEAHVLAAYKDFQQTYRIRAASPEEDKYRYAVFRSNFKKIEKHNADDSQTYKLGVTQFANLNQVEFVHKHLMNIGSPKVNALSNRVSVAVPRGASVDWREQGKVSPVRNQGSCGSCYGHSVTGAVESAYLISKGTTPILSNQMIVDCCGADGFQCQGCSGAWPDWAFNFVRDRGLVEDSEYPYTARVGTCKIHTGSNRISGYTMLPAGDVEGMKNALLSQPLSVCVDASNWSLYRSGVFNNCGTTLNHAVLAVGFNDNETIVKNSWSESWGQGGFIFLAPGNTCGIANYAIAPTV